MVQGEGGLLSTNHFCGVPEIQNTTTVQLPYLLAAVANETVQPRRLQLIPHVFPQLRVNNTPACPARDQGAAAICGPRAQHSVRAGIFKLGGHGPGAESGMEMHQTPQAQHTTNGGVPNARMQLCQVVRRGSQRSFESYIGSGHLPAPSCRHKQSQACVHSNFAQKLDSLLLRELLRPPPPQCRDTSLAGAPPLKPSTPNTESSMSVLHNGKRRGALLPTLQRNLQELSPAASAPARNSSSRSSEAP